VFSPKMIMCERDRHVEPSGECGAVGAIIEPKRWKWLL
jgi:hypothetical protein